MATLTTVEELLAEAAAEIDRLSSAEAREAAQQGDLLIDIRPTEERQRDGLVPGAAIVDRNVLEWRLDPEGEHRNPGDRRIAQGWMAVGLPLEPTDARSTEPG